MARYGKTVKLIQEMVKATNRKSYVKHTRQGIPVYELYSEGDSMRLIHYGTEIITYNLFQEKIVDYAGYSASDRDAMNTLLDSVNHKGKEFFRIVDGVLTLVN